VRKQPDAWTKAHAEVIQLMQEVQTNRANLQKAEARLREALDRMDAVMRKADAHAKPAPAEAGKAAPADPRLKDLEKKLDRLLDEVDALRREVRPKKTGAAPGPRQEGVHYVNTRAFQIPLAVRPDAGAREGVVYLSRDQGRTWEVAAKVSPTTKAVPFKAPADGDYWFAVRAMDKAPPSQSGIRPDLKVNVNTAAPAVGP
jgi:hypothetical protein